MPKIIAEIREDVLRETKRQLLGNGADALTMRSVATACNIAVGTLYNYFISKDVMVATVMLEDWLKNLQNMREGTADATNLKMGMKAVFDEINSFSGTYKKVWNTFQAQPQTASSMQERHGMLVHQVAEVIIPMAERLGCCAEKVFAEAAVQLLLQRAANGDEETFEELYPVLDKLLSK